MGGAPQVAMRVASQIWQIIFASQTLQVFRLALRKKAQYVVVGLNLMNDVVWSIMICRLNIFLFNS
jgi:multisubunit Na+/H+ antiporter MnhF subunit